MYAILMLPLVLMVLFWVFVFNRESGGRGATAFSRSSANVVPEDGTGVTFDDVAGVEEAAEELQEIVMFLKTPDQFTSLGGRPPKGVLLVGPPGTGKTLLARAVAGEAGVPRNDPGFGLCGDVCGCGRGARPGRFRNAGNNAPCIIFIDELDAVGKARGVGGVSGNDEREQTLNQLLVEVDGSTIEGVIVMAQPTDPKFWTKRLDWPF